MNATRCGSFPLMNLAQDFGVDYGDVLLIADGYREGSHSLAHYRARQGAAMRIQAALGTSAAFTLWERIKKASRWAR